MKKLYKYLFIRKSDSTTVSIIAENIIEAKKYFKALLGRKFDSNYWLYDSREEVK